MADVLRIKRRVTGSPGAPSSLANAELAYNEVDHVLYYGEGTGGSGGSASVIVAVGGPGIASGLTPAMDGVAAAGVATAWARGDHVHPTDTTRYAASNPSGFQTAAQITTTLGPYALLAAPTFTGVPTAPTASPGTNTTQLATTAFALAAATASGVQTFNTRSGAVTLSAADVTGAGGALLAAPAFTGIPTAPTATPGTNTTQLATTAFALAASAAAGVQTFNTRSGAVTMVAGDVSGAGGALLASPTFTGTVTLASLTSTGTVSGAGFTALLAPYAPLASPPLTGVPTAPTAAPGTSTTQLATTAFAMAASAAAGVQTFNTRSGAVVLTVADVTGVGGALLAGPAFTGVPSAPTAGVGVNTTQIATTAYVLNAVPIAASVLPLMDGAASIGVGTTWARVDHVHPVDTSRAPVNNPTFTGTVTIPGGAVITGYAPLASPTFTGTPTLPTGTTGITQASGNNTLALATTAFAMAVRQDQQAVPTASVSWNNQYLINLLDPLNPQDAATKHYVDTTAQGLSAKGAVVVATAGANITLSGLQTIDGYTTLAGDRVLVKDQTLQQNNGIYIAATTAWTRATDMDTWAEVPQAYVFVSGGNININSSWTCSSVAGGVLGTTAITWVQFSQAATITAGNGLTKVGNTISAVGTAGRILVGSGVDIDAAYVGQTSIVTLGSVATGTWNATTIAVARGGTGATTLSGYLFGNGTGAFTASASIPNAAITGLGSLALQAANAVAITGGTIDGVTFDMGTF